MTISEILSLRLWLGAAVLLTIMIPYSCFAQQDSASSPEFPELLVTPQGFVAIDTPRGWVRSDGPGLAFFVRKGDTEKTADVWIYISSAPIGPNEEDKNSKAYIRSDVVGFKERFNKGSVHEEASMELPNGKVRVPVYTFRSGEEHNAFEQIVYIPESSRVLVLVLSAKNKDSFLECLPIFRDFARSYRGSITESVTK